MFSPEVIQGDHQDPVLIKVNSWQNAESLSCIPGQAKDQ